MKIGLISDIHGNEEAWKKVLEKLENKYRFTIDMTQLNIEKWNPAWYNVFEKKNISKVKYSIWTLYRMLIKLKIYKKSTKQEKSIWTKRISSNDISRRKSTSRCKIYTERMFTKRIKGMRRKILSICSNRWIYKDVLLVEDGIEKNIKCALNAKVDSCWINRKNKINTINIKLTYEINNLLQIKRIIEEN